MDLHYSIDPIDEELGEVLVAENEDQANVVELNY